MKTIIKISICSLLITATIQAQSWKNSERIKGNGNEIIEKRTTSSYDDIKIMGAYDIELFAGTEGQITITAEENLMQFIKIEVDNNVLKIYTEKNKNLNSSSGKNLKIAIPFETLSGVTLTGSGEIITKNKIKSSQFALNLTGSGNLKLDIEADEIDTNLSGSGNITLDGKTNNLNNTISGSGGINTYNLDTKNADVTISGSGDIKVFCSESLKARVSGSGDIFYKGEPKIKDTKVSGSGKISKS